MARRFVRVTFAVLLPLIMLTNSRIALAQKRPAPAPEVNLIRFEGHLGPPQPSDRGGTNLWLNHGGKEYRFQLTRLRVLTGTRMASRIIADVQPYRPSLFLRGAETMTQRLVTARPSDRIQINGYLRAGTRDLMVTEVMVSTAARETPKPTPASSPVSAGTRDAP